MSLNGLNAHAVLDAHQAALANSEGWFLLRYVSRDEVGVLDRGIAGWEEARSSLSQYADPSPLYGYLKYRNKEVILKYIPEGTSRLLKARTAVHFQSFAEQFVHDASFDATTPNDLTAELLSAVCYLPALEEPNPPPPKIPPRAPGRSRQNTVETIDGTVDKSVSQGTVSTPGLETAESSPLVVQPVIPVSMVSEATAGEGGKRNESERAIGDLDTDTNSRRQPDTYGTVRMSSEGLGLTVDSPMIAKELDRPTTSASTKSDFFKNSFYNWKPKTKLFPRPVADSKPNVSKGTGIVRQKLPNGMKSRKVGDDRPATSKSSKTMMSEASTLPSQQAPQAPSPATKREPVSLAAAPTTEATLNSKAPAARALYVFAKDAQQSQSSLVDTTSVVVSEPRATQSISNDDDLSVINGQADSIPAKRAHIVSPERQRLMKALQMRKTQQLASSSTKDEAYEFPKTDQSVVAVSQGVSKAQIEPELTAKVGKDEQPTHNRPKNDTKTSEVVQRTSEALENKVHLDVLASPDNIASKTEKVETEPRIASQVRQQPLDVSHQPGKELVSDASSATSDDSLTHELESATVEEATPISVARSFSQTSPQTTKLSNAPMDQVSQPRCVTPIVISPPSRASALPFREHEQTTSDEVMQSTQHVSPSISDNGTPSFTKRSNVSSGISRRIQALADISSRETSPTAIANYGSNPEASQFLSSRKASASDETSRIRTQQRPSLGGSRASSILSATTRSRPKIDVHEALPTSHRSSHRSQFTDTVSITAQIVRNTSEKDANSLLRDGGNKGSLYRSPLIVEHQLAASKQDGSTSAELARPASRESSTTTFARPSFELNWRFASRSKTETTSQPPPPPKSARSMSNTSLEPVHENGENRTEAKESRTSRMLKRMSGLSVGSKKKVETRDNSISASETQRRNSLKTVVVGDLNVQLPDTLLWKWRWVEIDTFGNIVVSSSRSNERARHNPKRYHLSDFRPPFVPTLDRQELPHSVILEFVNGGTLQLACEDPVGQAQVFKRLLDSYHSWVS